MFRPKYVVVSSVFRDVISFNLFVFLTSMTLQVLNTLQWDANNNH
jgi:hypothetical protein